MLRITSHGITDIGLVRYRNEDYFEIDDRKQVYIVADGMGGHGYGDVAARMAVESMRTSIARGRSRQNGNGLLAHSNSLKRSIQVAHDKVQTAIQQDAKLLGMGTTVVSAMLRDETLAIAHVGDSRAYLLRGDQLELLTHDHSWVYEQVVAGVMSNEQAETHPLRSVVTRVVGGGSHSKWPGADVCEIDVRHGDLLLLCSDGLSAMLGDEEIKRHLAASADEALKETTRRLVYDANRHGGMDNITVVLLKVEED